MISLAGHAALVTGSSQGVGRAIALALARHGADVVVHGHRADPAAEATAAGCREHGVRAAVIEGDLADDHPHSAFRVGQRALETGWPIDLLVNNAGTYRDTPFLELDYQTFDRTFKLNVYAYFFLTQFLARYWVDQEMAGSVLMIGSINGRLAEPVHAAYDSSKGAVEMMVKTLCVSLAPYRIRVNGMAPGLVETPLTAPALADPRFRRWMEWHTPNGQVPDASVCGDAAAFLLSPQAGHITGQMLLVDGGMSAWQQPDPPPRFAPGTNDGEPT